MKTCAIKEKRSAKASGGFKVYFYSAVSTESLLRIKFLSEHKKNDFRNALRSLVNPITANHQHQLAKNTGSTALTQEEKSRMANEIPKKQEFLGQEAEKAKPKSSLLRAEEGVLFYLLVSKDGNGKSLLSKLGELANPDRPNAKLFWLIIVILSFELFGYIMPFVSSMITMMRVSIGCILGLVLVSMSNVSRAEKGEKQREMAEGKASKTLEGKFVLNGVHDLFAVQNYITSQGLNRKIEPLSPELETSKWTLSFLQVRLFAWANRQGQWRISVQSFLGAKWL